MRGTLLLLLAWTVLASPRPATADMPFGADQLRRLPPSFLARDTWTTAAGLALGGLAVWPRDEVWTDWAVREEPLGPGGRDNGYWMAHRYTIGVQILGLTAGGWLLGDDRLRDTGLLLAQAQGLSAGLTQVVKFTTLRERPDASNEHSFPSGHTTAAWTTAAVLQGRYGWVVGGLGYASAVYVGLSRIQAGKHHPSDVLVGFAVGEWCARAVLRSASELDRSVRWLVPVAGPRPALALVDWRF